MLVQLPPWRKVPAIGWMWWGIAVGVVASCNETMLLESRPRSREYLRYQYTVKGRRLLWYFVQGRMLSHSTKVERIATKLYRAWHPGLVGHGDVSDQPLY